jgi:glutathione S-transferase
MLTLYYAPGACSLSPHIVLREAELDFSLEKVDFKAGKRLPDGTRFSQVNPKDYVPALKLASGEVLTEGVAIVQYIADLRPNLRLAPAAGSFERVRLQEWLNFIATELHKGLGPFFLRGATDELKQAAKDRMAARLDFVSERLRDGGHLMGGDFTVADAYFLYFLRTWQGVVKGELTPTLAMYEARLLERPSVKAALQFEGLT